MEVQRKSRLVSDGRVVTTVPNLTVSIVDSAAAPQAQSKIKVLEKLPVLEPPEEDDSETFKYVSTVSSDTHRL